MQFPISFNTKEILSAGSPENLGSIGPIGKNVHLYQIHFGNKISYHSKGWKPQVFSLNGPIILDNGSFDLIFGPELGLTPRIALTVLGRDSPKLS